MFKHIEKLRNKSDAEKLRFIFGASAAITLVIALFWVVALIFKIENGGLSFEINTPQSESLKNIGSKISGSWSQFFPKSEPRATTTVSATSQATSTDSTVSEPAPYPADIGE